MTGGAQPCQTAACGVICLPEICRGILPLLLAHPPVCMGKDKDIQCIPETQTMGRENKASRSRNRKAEKGKGRREGNGKKSLLPIFAELPNLFTSFVPLCTFFLGQSFTWQLFRTATVER